MPGGKAPAECGISADNSASAECSAPLEHIASVGRSGPMGRSAAPESAGLKTGKLPVNAMKRSVLGQIRTKREEVLSGAGVGRDCAIFSSCGEQNIAICVQEAVVTVRPDGAVRLAERGKTASSDKEDKYIVGKPAPLSAEGTSAVRKASEGQKSSAPPGQEAVSGTWTDEMEMTMADLIAKCANNLAAGGARPVAVMTALLLPQDTQESRVRALMAQAEEKCRELSLELAGGQTRITAAAAMPIATVTGYGTVAMGRDHTLKAAAPGQDIVLSKWIGLQGTARIARSCAGQLSQRYPAWLVEEAAGFGRYLSVLPEAEAAMGFGVCAMHDASEGGILGALWELAEGAGTGLLTDMRKFPLRQETVEVCECCGANPYELLSGGCLVMTAWDGEGLAAALKAAGIPATVVGKLTRGNDRILTNGDEIRYLDRPKRDEIYHTHGR